MRKKIPSGENNASTGLTGLACHDLAAGYGKKIVLQGVELTVKPGKVVTLIGPNGSGKSTILKTITRQLKALGGCVSLDGDPMEELDGDSVAKKLSMVMTERPKAELMSCREVVSTGRYPYVGMLGILSKEDWQKVDEAMETVHAAEVADIGFHEISDGQRQRVMLARALCQEPRVLVLDEPTSFLDMRYKLDILTSIRRLAVKHGIAVIMSLHELELAMKVSDVIACVDGDTVPAVGSPEEIFRGDLIQKLYGVDPVNFDPLTGAVHLTGAAGEPKVFVIGGGGTGIPVYHALVRKGIPFAAGILQANDLECGAARAAAVRVIEAPAFYPIGEMELEAAKNVIDACDEVYVCVTDFGPLNTANRELADYAAAAGKKVRRTAEDDSWQK